ncbi:MAG: MFS transporter [Chloroflexota bacterium]
MADAMASDRAGARGWTTTLTAVCIAQATAIAGFDFTLPFIPLYLQHDLGVHGLGQTALWAGLISFGPALPATIFGPIWGRLADRIGYRFMLLRAMLSASVLIAMMGLAPTPLILLGLRMVQGALTGTVFSSQALVAATAPERETGRAMGLLQMSVSIGATFGPIGGGFVASSFGYRAAFLGAGALLGLATLVVFAFVREPARKKPRHMAGSASTQQQPSMMSVLALPAFMGALILTTVVQVAGTAFLPIVPLYVQELLHTSGDVASQTGWLLAVSGIAAAIGSYSAGRLNRQFALRPLLLIFVGASAALLVPQAFVHNFMSFLVLRAAAAVAFGALFGLVGTLAAISSPRDAKGVAFGMVGAASSIGFGAGPLLGGGLAAAFGIRPLFIMSAILLASMPATLWLATMVLPSILARFRVAPRLEMRLREQR